MDKIQAALSFIVIKKTKPRKFFYYIYNIVSFEKILTSGIEFLN